MTANNHRLQNVHNHISNPHDSQQSQVAKRPQSHLDKEPPSHQCKKRSTITYSHRQRTTITTMQKKSTITYSQHAKLAAVTPTHSFYPQHLRRSLAVHHTRISYREPLHGEAEHI